MGKIKDNKPKRSNLSQTEFPRESLNKALAIAQGIWENFAGKNAPPHSIALALELSPTSGGWRSLCSTSIAYGLTDGGYNAAQIKLTDLGRRIIAPTSDGDDARAKVEAILQPRIMGEFFREYNKANFPKENIAENVLINRGVPKERATHAVQLLRENGNYAGVLKKTKTGLFVALDLPTLGLPMEAEEETETNQNETQDSTDIEKVAQKISSAETPEQHKEQHPERNNKVFISHGKNKKIVDQLKELLTFGKFDPVVSIKKDTTSIPVPEKVIKDMRQCSAAVIHVGSEGELFDSEGNKHQRLNENVLIEIGAAMALYEKRFVLLVEKDVKLPSNLQGLYRCEYEGDQLDYGATMKLLQTFNEFQ